MTKKRIFFFKSYSTIESTAKEKYCQDSDIHLKFKFLIAYNTLLYKYYAKKRFIYSLKLLDNDNLYSPSPHYFACFTLTNKRVHSVYTSTMCLLWTCRYSFYNFRCRSEDKYMIDDRFPHSQTYIPNTTKLLGG